MPEISDIALTDQVSVRNLNHTLPADHWQYNKPVVLQWNSRTWTVPVGGETHGIPFEVIKKDFGDPRSTDRVVAVRETPNSMPEFIPDRMTEVRRLQQLYQNTVIRFREYVPGDRSFLEEGITDRAPKVEVYTLAGDRIYTVLDDPYGDRVVAAVPTRSDRDALAAQLAAQSELMAKMQAEVEELRNQLAVGSIETDAPPDNPAFVDPRPDPRLDAVLEENPPMVLDRRSNRVTRKKTPPVDPTRIEDLPTDLN